MTDLTKEMRTISNRYGVTLRLEYQLKGGPLGSWDTGDVAILVTDRTPGRPRWTPWYRSAGFPTDRHRTWVAAVSAALRGVESHLAMLTEVSAGQQRIPLEW